MENGKGGPFVRGGRRGRGAGGVLVPKAPGSFEAPQAIFSEIVNQNTDFNDKNALSMDISEL